MASFQPISVGQMTANHSSFTIEKIFLLMWQEILLPLNAGGLAFQLRCAIKAFIVFWAQTGLSTAIRYFFEEDQIWPKK
jgi:hypothetical protein